LVAKARKGRSFYQACRRLLTDEAFYRQVRETGLKNIDGRDWESVNQAILDEYARLLDRRPRT
jgi:hypothetical protein